VTLAVTSDTPIEDHRLIGHQPEAQGLYDPRFERDGCGIGALVHIKGERSHSLVQKALLMLTNLRHRGAQGHDAATGDGAGIILQIPHHLFSAELMLAGVLLPAPGDYAVGMVFLPRDDQTATAILTLFQTQCQRLGLDWLGQRLVPVDPAYLGQAGAAKAPWIVQIFIGRGSHTSSSAFTRSLFLARRLLEKELQLSPALQQYADDVHIASLSAQTIVYKGLLLPEQLPHYYLDLSDPRLTSALAAVHSRFSTNTFPAWKLAHPFHRLCHNGEINTIRGNLNWMQAREKVLAAELFGDFGAEILPLIRPHQSDSACLDDAVELLMLTGRSITEALQVLIPEAWQKNTWLDQARRAHAEYNATLMEPWDGPAAVCFTDGTIIGATLDRNGLRPCRYTITHDDLVILASETGVLPVPSDQIKTLGRLRPGEMLVIDTKQGQILHDRDLKNAAAKGPSYRHWLQSLLLPLVDIVDAKSPPSAKGLDLARLQTAFGITQEELTKVLAPMALSGEEAISSMGDDTPLAVLSGQARPLFDYFKQQFAQVTNPAIDALREDMVMSLTMYLGAKGSLTTPPSPRAHLIKSEHPVLTPGEVQFLRQHPSLATSSLSLLFDVASGPNGLHEALEKLLNLAVRAAENKAGLLILSDRGVTTKQAAIPSLLAVSAVHHHLIKLGLRSHCDLIVESGEVRSPHHLACLIAHGAAAVHPYMAFASIETLCLDVDNYDGLDAGTASTNYLKAMTKGLSKILSKMGISTLQSYCGSQLFEAIGLGSELMQQYFPATPGRLSGMTLLDLAQETLRRHANAFLPGPEAAKQLPPFGGLLHYRPHGEAHAWAPETIALLQEATRSGKSQAFARYSDHANATNAAPTMLRHLLAPITSAQPTPLNEVEAASLIVRRFTTGAMSLGAISKESHETLAIAMNRMASKSNTGEGGEDPARFTPLANGDSRSSAIKQIASGRFGVTINYLVHAEELQIKIAQGAKPGEGGQLPGHKVDAEIARLRYSTPGVQLISPPPHHDIYSIEDLAQLIFDLKNANPAARISVKLVAEAGIGAIAVGVVKAGAHKILVSGDGGGTGAAPITSLKHAGAPWEMGLAEVHQTLLLNHLRDRVVLETDGQLRTGRDVVIAAMLGADEFGFSTAPLVAQGCIMMRKCHLNTCPVGIATQDPLLRAKFTGQPEHVVNFFFLVAEEVRNLMASIGVTRVADLVGQTQWLEQKQLPKAHKAHSIDLSKLLFKPVPGAILAADFTPFQPDDYDATLLAQCQPALINGTQVVLSRKITNAQRSTGTLVSGEIARRFGAAGLPDGSISLRFEGSAGQSFGAFLAGGISLYLAGAANDYVGKGLSGGRIVIAPSRHPGFGHDPQVLIGNTTLYGATSGSLFIAGIAGERFAVRNSGALAVVEGIGDHGCEYMTGGVAVILGPVGRNFGAGMSGGVAFVLDSDGLFHLRCNTAMIDFTRMSDEGGPADSVLLKQIITRHFGHTQSFKAQLLLSNWEWHLQRFVRVTPKKEKQVSTAQPFVLSSVRPQRREALTHA